MGQPLRRSDAGLDPGGGVASTWSIPPGWSACPKQYTSGPRSIAAVPRTASIRWSGWASRGLEVSGPGEELLLMLFPRLRGLRILRVEDTGEAVAIRACCRAACARCPSCGVVSARIHGAYARVVADGAAGGRPVLIILAVRRFRCPDRSCAKATFAEQAEDLSVRYRRRSVPLLGMLAAFGLELGGRAGSRLAGFTTSGYYPGAISECTYQGKQYCYPIGTNSVGLLYNKAMLAAAGLQPPTTWDELAADAKELTKAPVYGMAFDATADEQSTWQLEPFFWSNGPA